MTAVTTLYVYRFISPLTVNGGMIVYNEGPFGSSLQISNELVIRLSRSSIQNLIDKLSF